MRDNSVKVGAGMIIGIKILITVGIVILRKPYILAVELDIPHDCKGESEHQSMKKYQNTSFRKIALKFV